MDFKEKNIINKNRGFTFAEILICLAIIGIIAVLTIPPFVENYQNTLVVSKYQKAYSEIFQAIKLSEIENGTIDTWVFSAVPEYNRTELFAEQYFYPYFQTVKKCSELETECWKQPVSSSNALTNMDFDKEHLSAITKNGCSIYFWKSADLGSGSDVEIWIDVDGSNKGRNMLGKDVFGIKINLVDSPIQRKGIFTIPLGEKPIITRNELINDSSYGCSTNSTGAWAGRYCGGLIAIDGWKMSNDYKL